MMVGDRRHDVQGASTNAMPCIGVLWGYGDEAELRCAGAAHVVSDMRELLALLSQ